MCDSYETFGDTKGIIRSQCFPHIILSVLNIIDIRIQKHNLVDKGIKNITELRAILQRESQNS
jgi:hypothetical protein